MASEGFGELLQKAEDLCSAFDTNAELPRVERSLQQILDDGMKLWNRTQHSASQDSVNVKAATLLGAKGQGVPHLSQKLESLSAAKTFEPLKPVQDTDIRAFLKNERDNALFSAIESTKKKTFEEAENRHWECLRDDWERDKQRLLNSLLGSGFTGDSPNFSLDSTMMNTGSATDTKLYESKRPGSRSCMDSVQLAYSQKVYNYNEDSIRGGVTQPLISRFVDMSQQFQDEMIQAVWRMVDAMCQVPVIPSENTLQSRTSPQIQKVLVKNALFYLENSYKLHIQNTVTAHLQKAMLGGVPGTIPFIKSYLKIVLDQHTVNVLEDGLVEDQPVWPFIYYCIRCGDLDAALTIAKRAASSIGDAAAYINEYVTNKREITSSTLNKLKLQYKRQIRTSNDPFKKLVFCVLGSCDINDVHADVADKIDDFLWLRLSQIKLTNQTSDHHDSDSMSLSQLQTQLLDEYGEAHFNAQQRPLLYFQVLLLTGQFEAAIDFLSHHDRLNTHAVHVAVCLYELGLLLTPNSISTQLLSREPTDPVPMRRLNFARLIMMYTRRFEATDPRDALQYYYFLRKLKHTNDKNLFVMCISELVLETREFDMLLGKIDQDGYRKTGAIDKFHEDTSSILEMVAEDTEKKGMFEEAVNLYDLAENQEKMISLLNHLLSTHASEPSIPGSTRVRVKSTAVNIATRLRSRPTRANKETTGTFYLLLDIATFFECYHEEQLDQAMDVVKQLKIIPFEQDAVELRVSRFKFFSDEIRRILPDVLLATMNILLVQYRVARSNMNENSHSSFSLSMLNTSVGDGGSSMMVMKLREQAKAVITFAGMIPYRLPGDVSSRLVQIEVLMN